MIKRINSKVRQSNNISVFHNSREDVRALGNLLNEVIDKVNEVVDTVNKQKDWREGN